MTLPTNTAVKLRIIGLQPKRGDVILMNRRVYDKLDRSTLNWLIDRFNVPIIAVELPFGETVMIERSYQ